MPAILAEEGPEIQWTEMAKTQYHRLFRPTEKASPGSNVDAGGPAAVPLSPDEETRQGDQDSLKLHDVHQNMPLSFKFAPDITHLVNPAPEAIVSLSARVK